MRRCKEKIEKMGRNKWGGEEKEAAETLEKNSI